MTTTQEFKLRGEAVLGKLKELVREGNLAFSERGTREEHPSSGASACSREMLAIG